MKYENWFASIGTLGNRKKIQLKEYMKTAKRLYYIEETRLKEIPFLTEREREGILFAKREYEVERNFEKLCQSKIRIIAWGDKEYPKRLLDILDPPYAIYVKGQVPMETMPTAAIVGARRCTAYGEKYAREFGEILGKHGIQVISGLARGIDGSSHRGALFGNGKTFAVLGCGVDICYPREHIGLYMDIIERGGGILSELPPGSQPLPYHFPKRNRIISGLSDIVLVIEARKKSGSLITADLALEQGKDVYALPGPIHSTLSQGCNHLIAQGAGILLSPEFLLEELSISKGSIYTSSNENLHKNEKMLERNAKIVYSCVGFYPKSISQLMEETKYAPEELLDLLVSLELQGYIKEISKNYYIKV